MSHQTDKDELLTDVMAEAGGFREAMLRETLARAKRRRRQRQLRPVLAVLILLGLAVPFLKRPARVVPSAPELSYRLVETQPLTASSVVVTQPMAESALVTSSASSDMEIVSTTSGGFQEIGDRQLLTLVAPHPAILAQVGQDKVELVFANPEDAKGFTVN